MQCIALISLLSHGLPPLTADQPIMNMMPRWDGGYGFQILADTTHRKDLKQGNDIIGDGYTESIKRLHLQGVYTWDRSIRLTFKLPYTLEAKREVPGAGGEKVVQYDKGLGDLTLALPLKHYFNNAASSGNWSLTPQLRVPLGENDGTYEIAKRAWGGGLSLGYEIETYGWFIATGIGAWFFEAPVAAEWNFSLDLGWNALDNLQVLWESDLHWDDQDAFQCSAGPALYLRWSDSIHSRLEWKHDFVSKVSRDQPDHGNGDSISIGIGFVY